MLRRVQQMPALWILIICTATGFVLGCAGNFLNFTITFERDPAHVIGQMPEDAVEIVSIVSPSLGMTVPIIRTKSGDLVAHGFLEHITLYTRQPQVHEPCSPANLAALIAEAGEILDCKQGAAVTEYCPSAIRAYALTEGGNLWLVSQERPCLLVAIFYGVLVAVAGAVVGFALLAVRVLLKPKRDDEVQTKTGSI